MSKHPHINETLEKLTELAHSYQEALECSNEILSMKNRMIELCEMEIELHRRENVRLQKTMFWLFIMFTVSLIVNIIDIFV